MSKKNDAVEVVMTNEEIVEVKNVAEEPRMGITGRFAARVADLSNKVVERSKEKAEKKAANSERKSITVAKGIKAIPGVMAGVAVVGGIAYGVYKVISSGKVEDTTVDVTYSENGFTVENSNEE